MRAFLIGVGFVAISVLTGYLVYLSGDSAIGIAAFVFVGWLATMTWLINMVPDAFET